MFFVEGLALSTICEISKAICNLLGVEVAWGDLLTGFMGCSAINTIWIHYGAVRATSKVENEFIDTLE